MPDNTEKTENSSDTESSFKNFDIETKNQNEKTIPMSKLRQTIARRLKDAQNTAAILTTLMKLTCQLLCLFEKKSKHLSKRNMVSNLASCLFLLKLVQRS